MVVRQWELLALLKARGRTMAELADVVRVHVRTVRRDLDALQEAGFPLVDKIDESDGPRRRTWRMFGRNDAA
jgi:predicted DNA-binding transcriptional regulator YafY